MPLKHNVTKYDVLATKIRKIALKPSSDLSKEEKRSAIMAVIVASLSSSHSWKTHNLLMDGLSNLNSEEVREEYRQAVSTRWKMITASDISEVLNKGVSATAFSQWLFFNVDQPQHSLYKSVWEEMRTTFMEACDDIELTEKVQTGILK